MGIIIYALFGSNIKFLVFDKRVDLIFDILNIIVMVIFVFDLVMNIVIRIDYLFSFYFFMDVASLILLFFDYSFIWESIFESDSSINKLKAYNFFLILEVFRLIRIMQLSKNFFRKRFKSQYSYYQNKLLMPKYMIEYIEAPEKDKNEDDPINKNHYSQKISFNQQKYSFRGTAMSRESKLMKNF